MGVRLNKPIRVEGEIAYVPLSRGLEAVIDAADVHLIAGWSWAAYPHSRTFYAFRSIATEGGKRPPKKTLFMHRVISGVAVGVRVDHMDVDGLNNRRSNLRVATQQQNCWNRRTPSTNTTGFKVNYRTLRLGIYDTPQEAHAAYCVAAHEHFGEFARVA